MVNSLMAVKIGARAQHASEVQDILTKYGCNIKTRVGFHDTDENHCSTDGILILQLFGEDELIKTMLGELNAQHEVSAKFIEF
jgi:hypothetical protein